MNKLFTKIATAFVGIAMAIGVGVAVDSGRDVSQVHAGTGSLTVNATNLGYTSTSYSNKTAVAYGDEGFKFSTTDVCKQSSGNNFQLKKTTGYLWNSDCPTGYTVNSIQLTNKSGGTVTVKKGSSAKPSTAVSAGSNNTYTINDKFFSISGPSAASYFTLVINYTSGPTKLATPSPSYNDETKKITWSAIEHASKYQVSVDSTSSYKDAESPYDVSGLTTGVQHTIYVVAKGDGTNYSDSDAGSRTFTPTAPKVLSSIAVTTPPNKTTYNDGETFNPAGMVVTATYEGGSTSNVTSSCTFTPSGALSASDTSITVSYTLAGVTKTTTQTITVNEVTKYQLITDTKDLVSGCNYVIGNNAQTHFISTTQANNNRTAHTLSGSISADNKVSFEEGIEVIELLGSAPQWKLHATSESAEGYLYAAGANSNNYLRTKSDETTWTISISGDGTATLVSAAATRGLMRYNPNNGSPMFSCYATDSTTGTLVTLWKEISTAQSISISEDSVEGFKTDTDKTISITAVNFDPTDIEVAYSTAGIATVTKGTIDDGVIPLNVAFNDVGTTTATITVKGGNKDYDVDLDIEVKAKPDSIAIKSGNTLELQNGSSSSTGSRSYTKASLTIKDTDGNDYSISSITNDVTLTNISGDDCVTISGGTITAKSVGECTVRFSLNILPSVYTDLSVSVINDYNASVNTITFNSGLTAKQGDTVNTGEVFASKVATTHFNSTANIADSELLFSYENDRATAVAINMFAYDFEHGTEVDASHKSQTINVFVTFDENYVGTSFTITVEQKSDPLTAITLTNKEIENDEVDLVRGSSLQLTWKLTPTNPTDTRELQFSVDDHDEGVKVQVSDSGNITVSSDSGLGTAAVLVEAKYKTSVYTYLYVNVTLESMTYIVSEPVIESFVQITDENDIVDGEYLMVGYYEDGDTYYYYNSSTGADNSQTGTVTVDNGTIAVTDDLKGCTFKIESVTGGYSFKNKTNPEQYISASNVGSSSNGTTKTNDPQPNVIELNDDGESFTISSNSHYLQMNPNKTGTTPSPLFRYYKSTSASYIDLLLFKYESSGGDTPHNVDETLFNGVHNNFGDSDATYSWDEYCSSFDLSSWTSAGAALKGITGFSTYELNLAVGNIEGNEIEVFIAKYDIVVAKFYKDCKTDQEKAALDFLGRVASGKVTPVKRVMILGDNAFNSNTSIIVVIVSLVSAVSVGGYFFLRKKKED